MNSPILSTVFSSGYFYFTLVYRRHKIKVFRFHQDAPPSAQKPTPGPSRGFFCLVSVLGILFGLFSRSIAMGAGFRSPQQQLVIAGSPAVEAFLIGATQRLGFHPVSPLKNTGTFQRFGQLSAKKCNFVI
jgi:hypothetical protein